VPTASSPVMGCNARKPHLLAGQPGDPASDRSTLTYGQSITMPALIPGNHPALLQGGWPRRVAELQARPSLGAV